MTEECCFQEHGGHCVFDDEVGATFRHFVCFVEANRLVLLIEQLGQNSKCLKNLHAAEV